MRIYLAGMIQTGFVWRGNSQSENVLITDEMRVKYPWDLESFHYIGDNKNAPAYFRELGKTIFLDSGAFSMFTQGIAIDLGRYSEYITENQDWIHIASNIDEIGQGKEAESYRNQKQLEKLLGPKLSPMLCPVHHARDADKWLQKYLADGYDYIFLGGMVPETTKYLRGWLDHVWHRYLTNKDGTAKVKVHGFGLTTLELMSRYPWYSVDSTSWVMTGRFGAIFLDWPDGRVTKLAFSTESPTIYKFDRHYDNLAPTVKRQVDERVRELGYDPELLRTHYGWRDHFNIGFFQRYGENLRPVFRAQQKGVFDDA